MRNTSKQVARGLRSQANSLTRKATELRSLADYLEDEADPGPTSDADAGSGA